MNEQSVVRKIVGEDWEFEESTSEDVLIRAVEILRSYDMSEAVIIQALSLIWRASRAEYE